MGARLKALSMLIRMAGLNRDPISGTYVSILWGLFHGTLSRDRKKSHVTPHFKALG